MGRWFIDRSPSCATPTVRLRAILPDATFIDGEDCDISGCSDDATLVEPGQVYVAVSDEGRAAVATAVGRGAVGVVVDRPLAEVGPPRAIVPDARAAHARLCHALAGDPSSKLDIIGITGDDDAAVVARLLRSIFAAAGERFGSVGTEGWSDGLAQRPVGAGFPGPEALAAMMAEMLRHRCIGGVVEFGQDAIESTSVADGLEFAAAVVPGVSDASGWDRDVRNARRRAYARLVRRVRPGGVVVVNGDDADAEILGAVNLRAHRVSYAIDGPADVRGFVDSVDAHGSRFRVVAEGVELAVSLRLGGEEAIRHALAAFAMAWAHGLDFSTIVAGLEAVDAAPGRFELVAEGQPFEVRVDAASRSDEMVQALAEARSATSGKVVCVVRAEGHGERDERRRLADAVEAGADLVVFTSDNPRGESPARIIDDLLSGTRWPRRARVEPDRRRAIELALAMAEQGDIVLIAGKGRNAFQILADRVVPFDDRAVAARWLREAAGTALPRRESA